MNTDVDDVQENVQNLRISRGLDKSRAVEVNQDTLECFVLAEEPSRITDDDFREFLMSCVLSGASDVTIQSDQQPRAEIHGVIYRATRKLWSPSEVDQVLCLVYGGSNARAELDKPRVLDFSYELNLLDGGKQRFRVNATGIYGRDGKGVEITLRALPSETPSLEMVNLEGVLSAPANIQKNVIEVKSSGMSVLDAMRPKNGIVVVAGGTGSGKSTTLAAVMRSFLENEESPVKIVDIQAPIEYTYRDITNALKGSSSLIGQSEIGKHIDNFALGVHSALRRKPDIICVGEARDYETIAASLEASLTGHLVYTTTHANDVSDTIRRLLTTFPALEREARAFDLISALRFLMVQYLLPRIDRPGRVPVREYIRFTPRLKEKLVLLSVNDWPSILGEEVLGQIDDTGPDDMCLSLGEVVTPLYEQGIIARSDAFLLGGLSAVANPPDGEAV